MIKKLLSSVFMASALLVFTSCLKDSENNTTYYDDTAVTAFTLGTVNQYLHTKDSDGVTDKITKVSYSASQYVFRIDQLNREIFNPDSLPYGTDATKILCTVTTKNSGMVVLTLKDKNGKDSLAAYSKTDSIDFSSPVKMRVYSHSGEAYRDYTVRLNVHQQAGNEIDWKRTAHAALNAAADRNMVCLGTQLYIFAQENGQTVVYRREGSTLAKLTAIFDANAYRNVAVMGGQVYVVSGGSVMRSADGKTWEQTGSNAAISRLLGAGTAKLYALTGQGIVASADQGATWTSESLDDDAAHLPTDNINFACMASKANAETNKLFLIGQRDGKTVVWSKVEENANGSQQQPWAFYADDEYNRLTLPLMANLRVIAYGGELIAMGGDFSTFYHSQDQGITWTPYTDMALPESFGRNAAAFALAVDETNIVYLSRQGEAAIWSGRIARLGWANNQ